MGSALGLHASSLCAGCPLAGQTAEPLADLQAWQVEQLTRTGVKDLSLYRAAFTHKTALPLDLRVAKVGCCLWLLLLLPQLARRRRAGHAARAPWHARLHAGPLSPCLVQPLQSYERLEYLGDSVLSLTVRGILMRRFPGRDEVRQGVKGLPGWLLLLPLLQPGDWLAAGN